MTHQTYGLHPTIWRKLRKKVYGGNIELFDPAGNVLCEAFLFRYEAIVDLPITTNFKDVSWKKTIEETQPEIVPAPLMPSNIPIGCRTYG